MADGIARVGAVDLRLEGGDGGIAGWTLRGDATASGARGAPDDSVDGLPTDRAPRDERARPAAPEHPNTAFAVDHVVVFTPDLKRSIASLEGEGFELRRIRDATEPGPDVRQAFFRPGETIVEVVENPRAEGPAAFWGLTVAVRDMDRAAAVLGDRLGEVRDAVQPGRRIATVRKEAGLGVPVALITPHPGDGNGGRPVRPLS